MPDRRSKEDAFPMAHSLATNPTALAQEGPAPSSKQEQAEEALREGQWHRGDWPLQTIRFRAQVAIPRQLTVLEKIVLHTYLTLEASPPEPETVTTELALADPFFVEQTIQELRRLGAVDGDFREGLRVTDLGWECSRRGQVPSVSREQVVAIVFDPVAGRFPDVPVEPAPVEPAEVEGPRRPVVSEFALADPRRIDLATFRQVAACQRQLSESADAVVFSAEPVTEDPPTEACPDAEQPPTSTDGLWWQPVRFRGVHSGEQISKIEVRTRSALSPWFEKALNDRSKAGQIHWHDPAESAAGAEEASPPERVAASANGKETVA